MTGNFLDRMEDEMENYPEGEHDDQVDATPFPDIKPPVQLRRWFNIMMLIINLVAMILLLGLLPLLVGLFLLDQPETLVDWLNNYVVGLVGVAGIIFGAIYFGVIFNETRKGIKRNITLIRKNLR